MIPSARYVERLMVSLTCQIIATGASWLLPKWYVIIAAVMIHLCALALIFLSRTDEVAR